MNNVFRKVLRQGAGNYFDADNLSDVFIDTVVYLGHIRSNDLSPDSCSMRSI